MKGQISQYHLLASLMLIMQFGCAGSGASGITYDDFRNRASALAGVDSIDCGNAEIGSGLVQNSCVSRAFVEGKSVFATYDIQGFDSRVASGLAISIDGRVYQLFFDGKPSGVVTSFKGDINNGDISITECINARLSGVVDNQLASVFNCG